MASDSNRRTKFIGSLIIWAISFLLVGGAVYYEKLGDIESKTWDWRLRAIAKTTVPDPRIKIIMIDQASIDRMARELKIYWTWPRSIYNPVLYFLKAAGARAIAFDVLFTESSNYTNQNDDVEFGEAVGSTIPVISAVGLSRSESSKEERENNLQRMELFKKRQAEQPPFEEHYLRGLDVHNFPNGLLPITELLTSSAAFGNVQEDADADGIFRRIAPGAFFNGIPILGLSFALHHLINPDAASFTELKSRADRNGRYLIKFRGPPQTYPWYSIDAVVSSWIRMEEGKSSIIDLTEFKDAIVFVGMSAQGLFDLRPSPFGDALYPGVEIHATALDNLIHKDFLREVPFLYSAVVAAAALALVIITCIYFVKFQIAALIAIFLSWAFICLGAAHLGWWLPMVNPFIGMILATIATVAFQYQLEGKQRKFIRNAFQYYVTPEVIDKIVADPTRLSLGGDRRELTIFFSDIQGFTALSESMEPAKLVQFLNKFLSEMTDIILASGGTIDKYEGDAIIAFWNAPLSIPDHQFRAVTVALACQRRLHELTGHFQATYGVKVAMRVGLNTGLVTVGNFGSSTRFNYTMIGDAANLASRLEGANKVFGSRVLVADVTRQEAQGGITWRKLGDIRVVGKSKIVTVWEPLDDVVHSDLIKKLPIYESALESFERGDLIVARDHFGDLSGDAVSVSYIARIDKLLSAGLGAQFTHVWNLTEK